LGYMSAKVEDVMVKNVKTASPEESVLKTAEIMNQYEIGCIVVTENSKPVGVVTERDILKRVVRERRDPAETKLHEVMSRPLVTVEPAATIVSAARIMIKHNIKKLPVMSSDHLVGILSLTDLIPLLKKQGTSKISLKSAPEHVKRAFEGYLDPETNMRKKCPLIILAGAPIGCLGPKCMWYDANGCARAR
jgi:CBS domain-containing protein